MLDLIYLRVIYFRYAMSKRCTFFLFKHFQMFLNDYHYILLNYKLASLHQYTWCYLFVFYLSIIMHLCIKCICVFCAFVFLKYYFFFPFICLSCYPICSCSNYFYSSLSKQVCITITTNMIL